MNGFNFTERTRKVLAFAREEAVQRLHDHVGTEHILLGILRDGGGVAVDVLERLHVKPDVVRRDVAALMEQGTTTSVGDSALPYSSRAKKSLELAMAEARELRHSYIGTEHILLGVLREGTSPAAQILSEAGVTVGAARSEMQGMPGSEPATASATPTGAEMSAAAPAISNITIEMRFDDGSVRREDFMSVEAATRYLNQH
jgi:ATP-dependent Clp protease ATP-binding subunit ClpC